MQEVLNEWLHIPRDGGIRHRQNSRSIAGVKERWKFIEATLKKAPYERWSMIGRHGMSLIPVLADRFLPYLISDGFFIICRADLRFLLNKFKETRWWPLTEFRSKV